MATKPQAPDLAEFYALSKPKSPPCQIGLILGSDELSKDEREQFIAALQTDKGFITGAAIQVWLKNRGIETNVQRISNHRRGVCSCDRPL